MHKQSAYNKFQDLFFLHKSDMHITVPTDYEIDIKLYYHTREIVEDQIEFEIWFALLDEFDHEGRVVSAPSWVN